MCLNCHSAPGFGKEVNGAFVSLHIDATELASSVHASRDCFGCHADFIGQSFPHKQKADPVQCSRCHHKGNAMNAPDSSHIENYVESVHGDAAKRKDPDAPKCSSCHGKHGIRSPRDPRSTVYQTNIPNTCGKCHFNTALAKRHNMTDISDYKKSVHAKIQRKDRLVNAAVCTDCHGIHNIQTSGNPGSMSYKQNVPATCAKCHKSVFTQYSESIHGTAVAKGNKDAPVCTDCHGEHGIEPKSAISSSVYPEHVVATCSKCHEDTRIQRKYGLPAGRLASYMSSYHGIANKFGDITVANCATCHTAHHVLPSSDLKSSINKKNIPATCGKCHPGAGLNFAKGTVHL
ncbi:MAG: cytochrome c3 family protein, partial [Armatimonadota bacterium]